MYGSIIYHIQKCVKLWHGGNHIMLATSKNDISSSWTVTACGRTRNLLCFELQNWFRRVWWSVFGVESIGQLTQKDRDNSSWWNPLIEESLKEETQQPLIKRMDDEDRVSQWALSHICCANKVLWVYIPQLFTYISTRNAKVWWGLWVSGLHEKLTISESRTTSQAPYLLLHVENSIIDEDNDMEGRCCKHGGP